jgi:hypothetical protein
LNDWSLLENLLRRLSLRLPLLDLVKDIAERSCRLGFFAVKSNDLYVLA